MNLGGILRGITTTRFLCHVPGMLLVCAMAVAISQPAWPQDSQRKEIDRLIEILESTDDLGEATEAAQQLATFGPAAAPAVPALIDALRRLIDDGRDYSSYALSEIGEASVEPLADLIQTSRDVEVLIYAMDALGRIGPAASHAAPAMISLLTDRDDDIARHAMDTLPRLEGGAVPALRDAMSDRDPILRRRVAYVLGAIGREAAPAIAELLVATADRDASVRRNALAALGTIGQPRGDVIASLLQALDAAGEDPEVRIASAKALGRLAHPDDRIVLALIATLDVDDVGLCNASAEALGRYPDYAGQTVQPLIDALRDPRYQPARGFNGCGKAIPALGRIGTGAVSAVPGLVAELSGVRGFTMRDDVEASLDTIALRLQSEAETLSDKELGDAIAFLEAGRDAADPGAIFERLDGTARLLALTLESRWTHRIATAFKWLGEHRTIAGVAAYIIGVPTLCFLILWLRPLWILRINNVVKQMADIRLPGWAGGITVPVSTLLLVGLFHYHHRVLDAWVAAHAATARRRFELKDTVAGRNVHIDVPVVVDGVTVPDFSSKTLGPIFERRLSCTLIRGEGGSGKTSLACQIARWAMSEVPDERPAGHLMLPILIEHELDFAIGGDADPLTEAIGRQLQDLIESPSPVRPELLIRLLRQQRILVIVDHLSEMSEATNAKIRPGAPNFPANALIVTSRLEEEMGGVVRSLIQPLRVAGNRLSSFMEAYLVKRGKRHLLDDQAFFEGCSTLSAMVGRRRITVLLAKLYAEQMIALAEEFGEAAQPQSIPDLMLQYLNRVNRSIKENRIDDRAVHADAKRIAWMCLEARFRPTDAAIDEVLDRLGGTDAADRLSYLEGRLNLVQVKQPAQDRVRIVLDPLAEYLAGLHVVGDLADSEEKWRAFLTRLEDAPGAPEGIRGFVLALLDCCRADDGRTAIPGFVQAELARLSDTDDATDTDQATSADLLLVESND